MLKYAIMRILVPVILMLVAGAVNLVLWWAPNRPFVPAEPPSEKVRSVSYAPFRDGQSPLTRILPTAAEIEADLALLAGKVGAVRTYTSREGLEIVPALARRYGLTVTHGAWLGMLPAENEREIAALIEAARRNPDTVTRVIVGNEVLLRGELSVDQLRGYLRRVRQAVDQPVSYADVWERWLRHPELAEEVDFITIHILPYWEDHPAGADDVETHVRWAREQIAARFPDKPILIGETGWPTAGRSRGPAEPGVVDAARFLTRFVALAEREGWDYNIIEAFDQNWKAEQEGTVGAYWGLYSADRTEKFSLAGPVVENRWWVRDAILSTILAAAMLVLAGWPGGASIPGAATTAALAQGGGAAIVLAAKHALAVGQGPGDTALATALLIGQGVIAIAVLRMAIDLCRMPTAEPADAPPTGNRTIAAIIGKTTLTLLALVAIALNALLVFDGRYRDFPVPHFVVPALAPLALGILGALRAAKGGRLTGLALGLGLSERTGRTARREADGTGGAGRGLFRAVTAAALCVGAVATVATEGIGNEEALFWAAVQIALAITLGLSAWIAGGAGNRLSRFTDRTSSPEEDAAWHAP